LIAQSNPVSDKFKAAAMRKDRNIKRQNEGLRLRTWTPRKGDVEQAAQAARLAKASGYFYFEGGETEDWLDKDRECPDDQQPRPTGLDGRVREAPKIEWRNHEEEQQAHFDAERHAVNIDETDNGSMAIKAVAVDDQNTQHLIIGLNRENINSLLDGEVFTLPKGVAISLTEDSDIVLLFAENDKDLEKRFPPMLRPS
jgi:hypothetical protein